MNSQDNPNQKIELVYMFLDVCSPTNKDEIVCNLRKNGYRPRVTEIIQGELDGKYDISLPLTDFILLYSNKISQEISELSLGAAYEDMCATDLLYAIDDELTDYKVKKHSENYDNIVKYRKFLNSCDLGNIAQLAELEKWIFAPTADDSRKHNKMHRNNVEKRKEAVEIDNNLSDENLIFTHEKQKKALKKRYSLAEVEKFNVLVSDGKSSNLDTAMKKYHKKGYYPRMLAVPVKLGDTMKTNNYISIPFYAFIDWVGDSHSKKSEQEKQKPLGSMLIRTLRHIAAEIDDPVFKRHYKITEKGISDNIKHFNKYTLNDTGKLFDEWQQKQRTGNDKSRER